MAVSLVTCCRASGVTLKSRAGAGDGVNSATARTGEGSLPSFKVQGPRLGSKSRAPCRAEGLGDGFRALGLGPRIYRRSSEIMAPHLEPKVCR